MPKKRRKRTITAERITALRRRTGLTQDEFAEKIGISPGLIKYMETGDRSLTAANMEKYVDYFKCPPEYITGEDDCPYTGITRALALLSEDAWDKMRFRSALRALVSKDIPPAEIDILVLKGLIDEDQLLKEAYTHMITFLREELRKASEKDEHPDELPESMAAFARNAAESTAPIRKLQEATFAPMRAVAEQLDVLRRAAERAENKKAPDSPRPVEKSPKR